MEKPALIEVEHLTCGGIAFRYLGAPVPGEVLKSQRAVLASGARPMPGDYIECEACGEPVNRWELIARNGVPA